MTSQKTTSQESVVLQFFDVYQTRNYDAIHALVAQKYHDFSPVQARNPDDVVRVLKTVHQIFPDLQVSVEDIFSTGEKVAVRVAFKGTHRATYIDAKASGKLIEWEALEIFRVTNGQITESWGYWPDLAMLSQMK